MASLSVHRRAPRVVVASLVTLGTACGGGSADPVGVGDPNASPVVADAGSRADAALDAAPSPTALRRFRADAWADNWFAMYLGDRLVKEDSVPITTERSFNAESFTFEAGYPFTLSFVLKDYAANASGLEYIGMSNQQIGDGGFAFQLRDEALARTVLVSDASWKCLPIFRAPLNPSCEKDPAPLTTCQSSIVPEPTGWRAEGFDDAAWPNANLFTAAEVGPKDGYLAVTWDPAAKFVWSSDLKIDNTVLCRVTVRAPRP